MTAVSAIEAAREAKVGQLIADHPEVRAEYESLVAALNAPAIVATNIPRHEGLLALTIRGHGIDETEALKLSKTATDMAIRGLKAITDDSGFEEPTLVVAGGRIAQDPKRTRSEGDDLLDFFRR